MGVKIGSLIQVKEVELTDLVGKIVGVDGYNTLYQFLSRIRDKQTGEPLRDKSHMVTSHLSGLFYRATHLIEAGIKPIFVWDGKPPKLKQKTIIARKIVREEAAKKWAEALDRGEEAMVYAQAASRLTPEMVEEAIRLLEYMGIPYIRAPSEGEAQLAVMAMNGDIWASASQDWDSLLFNSPRLVRNLSITGRRKVPRKNIYVKIRPEIVELENALENLRITREQLIIIGILIGTDYNFGVKGIGPKTALRLVNKYKTLDQVLTHVKWGDEVDAEDVLNFFLEPPAIKNYEIKWKEPNIDKLVEFMVDGHDFSQRRVERGAKLLERSFLKAKEKSLEVFFD